MQEYDMLWQVCWRRERWGGRMERHVERGRHIHMLFVDQELYRSNNVSTKKSKPNNDLTTKIKYMLLRDIQIIWIEVVLNLEKQCLISLSIHFILVIFISGVYIQLFTFWRIWEFYYIYLTFTNLLKEKYLDFFSFYFRHGY